MQCDPKFHPARLLQACTVREEAGCRFRARTLDGASFEQLTTHPPTALHDSAEIILNFLRSFDNAILCGSSIKALHKAAKSVQRRIRGWIERKTVWKTELISLWCRIEKEQQRALQQRVLQSLRVGTARTLRAAEEEGSYRETDKTRRAAVQDYLVMLCHQYSRRVQGWSDMHGARCKQLTIAFKGFVHVATQLRADLATLKKGKAKWKLSRSWQYQKEVLDMQKHLDSLSRQRLELVVGLMETPTRPRFPFSATPNDVAWLMSRRRKAAKSKIDSVVHFQRCLQPILGQASTLYAALPAVDPTPTSYPTALDTAPSLPALKGGNPRAFRRKRKFKRRASGLRLPRLTGDFVISRDTGSPQGCGRDAFWISLQDDSPAGAGQSGGVVHRVPHVPRSGQLGSRSRGGPVIHGPWDGDTEAHAALDTLAKKGAAKRA